MDRQPNNRLADLIDEAGVSHIGLARRLCEVAAEWGERTRPAHTQVSRWIAGQQPRGRTPALIAEALSRKLGRRVSVTDIGMAGTATSPEVGLEFPQSSDDLVQFLAELWQADIKRQTFLLGAVNASTLTHPVLDWLLSDAPSVCSRSGRRQVGRSDVTAVRETAAMFTGLDNRLGGAHARTAAVQYLSDQVTPLLHGSYTDTVGSALFSAVSEFNLTVAWMAYDSGIHGLGRRYFIQALALARHAGDRPLGTSVLSAMSHQANYLGEHSEALKLARAASHGISGMQQPLLQAQFATMQARAADAMPNSTRACVAAIGDAETALEKHNPGEEPEWISYFDDAEFADELAHSYRDLGDPNRSYSSRPKALRRARRSTSEVASSLALCLLLASST